MAKKYKRWYFLCYDICKPARLKRVHRIVKKQGIALQYSVFAVAVTHNELRRLMQALDKVIDAQADDIRFYPITHPSRMWLFGDKSTCRIPKISPTQQKQTETNISYRLLGFLDGLTKQFK